MAATLRKLYTENNNPFCLTLQAGQNSVRNKVSWVYMLEDEDIISYFHGSELAVTTASRFEQNPKWLLYIVRRLCEVQAAGLIINIGRFIFEIPQEVLDFCNLHDFPLLTMPWDIRITEMTQSFCVRIIQEQHESMIHDQAMADAILHPENEKRYCDILERYYDLSGYFTVIIIYTNTEAYEELHRANEMESILLNQVRRYKTINGLRNIKFGLISHEHYELMILNNIESGILPDIRNIILDVYRDAAKAKAIYMGVGINVQGITRIHKSFDRAQTAMRMAIYRNEPFVRFEEMGFFKILFSIKDDEILYQYADEILSPIDLYSSKGEQYLELLKAYIQNDRSLEKTAVALFLHRNTVNYQLQKLKQILNSPLKTLEDLFPYQAALAIRDMQKHSLQAKENNSIL